MPLYRTIPESSGIIAVWHLTETLEEIQANAPFKWIESPDFGGIKNTRRKQEWLTSRMLISQIAGDFDLQYAPDGRPILFHPEFKHISISHSNKFLAVFLHKEHEIGLDLESLGRNFQAISHKYLSDNELVLAKKNPELYGLFWCVKEAIFKLVQDQGIDFRKQINIVSEPDFQQQIIEASFSNSHTRTSYTIHFCKFEGHFLVWAMNTPIGH